MPIEPTEDEFNEAVDEKILEQEKPKKYIRLHWDGWDWKAFKFTEEILQECLEDGSIQEGDKIYEIRREFKVIQDKPKTLKLEEKVNGNS